MAKKLALPNKILGDRLTAKVAVGCGLLVLGLTQGQGLRNGTRAAVELNPYQNRI